jgi:tripartite-type tricarboxylate transporter receptor subunit TctC
MLSPVLAAVPLVRSGRMIALGVTTSQRAPGIPEVPTIAEAGLDGFEYQGWYGVLAPGKTPRPIIRQLAAEITRIIETPDAKERIASQGAVAKSSTPEEFDKLVREEIVTRIKVWKAAGVKPD